MKRGRTNNASVEATATVDVIVEMSNVVDRIRKSKDEYELAQNKAGGAYALEFAKGSD